MSDINITISGKKRLLTAGKYCDKNIVITPVGGGDFSGEYVIPVDELPTENIDTNALYLCKGAYYKPTEFGDIVDVFAIIDAENSGLLTQYYASQGTTVRFDIIPTRNSDVSAPADDEVLWCFIEDENAILGYAGEYGWLPISVILGAELPFGGFITDTSEATEPGYYALMTRGWTKYLAPTGTLEITESGTYDVSEYASAEVNVQGGSVQEYDGAITIS